MAKKEELRTKEKEKKFNEWFANDHVLIHLDSRKPGVQLPDHLLNNPSVTLKLSALFQGKTTITRDSVTSFLRFSGVYSECIVPWTAIWGMTAASGENIIWQEDLSPELLLQMAASKIKDFGGKLLGKKKEQPPEEPAPDDPPKNKPGKVHPFLRRIK